MTTESTTTITDHEAIRRWIEERGGMPAALKNTMPGDEAGVLYVDFPGYDKKDVAEMTWETFFKIFEEQNLAFKCQEIPPGTNPTGAWQLVDRDTGESVMA